MALGQETIMQMALKAYENCMKMIKIWVDNDPVPKRDKESQFTVASKQFSIVIQAGLLQAAISNGHISDDEISFLEKVSSIYPGVLGYVKINGNELDWGKIDRMSDSEAIETCNDVYEYCSGTAKIFAENYGSIAKSRGNEAREFLNLVKFIFEIFAGCDTLTNDKGLGKKAVREMFLDLWENAAPASPEAVPVPNPAPTPTPTPAPTPEEAGKKKVLPIDIGELIGVFKKKPPVPTSAPSVKTASTSRKMLNKDGANLVNYVRNKKDYTKAIVFLVVESFEGKSTGTGFLITEDGYAVTNAHVVENATKVTAMLSVEPEKHTFVCASVVSVDKAHDAAIIKLEGNGYNYCQIDDSCIEPALGEDVAILGYPFGLILTDKIEDLNISFTRGYVSSNQQLFGQRTTFLDINAFPGNSGSPVVNLATGEVIGILSGAVKENIRMIQIRYMIDLLG